MYLPICVCFNSATKTGSTNRKAVNCKNIGTACSKSVNCHICAKFANYLSQKDLRFAELFCGPPTFAHAIYYIDSFVDIDWQTCK